MDEILASIRRIIESSDEKPGRASTAAQGRPVAERDPVDGTAAISLPTQAARVVPFSDRASSPPEMPAAAAPEEDEERWVPMAEPANSAGDPPAAALSDLAQVEAVSSEPSASGNAPLSSADAVESILPADRWAQEFDDAQSWSVIAETGISAQPAPDLAAAFAPVDEMGPQSPDAILAPETVEASAASTIDERVEDEDDFLVDFDEADFVEALDRNAAAADMARDEAEEVPEQVESVSLVTPSPRNEARFEQSAPQAAPVLETSERSAVPAFLGARAALSAQSAPASEPVMAAPSMMQQASALMSEQAGIQVAAAFDDLARAIRDGQMTSMEDMTREMLRPMLQEWLDDNLPRLVERLVREEIERVSRGGRR